MLEREKLLTRPPRAPDPRDGHPLPLASHSSRSLVEGLSRSGQLLVHLRWAEGVEEPALMMTMIRKRGPRGRQTVLIRMQAGRLPYLLQGGRRGQLHLPKVD